MVGVVVAPVLWSLMVLSPPAGAALHSPCGTPPAASGRISSYTVSSL